MPRKRIEEDNTNNIIMSEPTMTEIQEIHESKNPQLLAQQKLRHYSHPVDNVAIQDNTMQIIEEHVQYEPLIGFENEYVNPLSNVVNQFNEVIENYNQQQEAMQELSSVINDKPVVTPVDEVPFEEAPNEEISTNEVIQENNNGYPRMQNISKENFARFVNSLDILKNLKQNVIFENGITHFVSDNKAYICKFDIHCPEISFKIPFVEQQSSQLSFLTKGSAVTIVESEDDYIFNEGQFKFQLRKITPDNDTWNADIFNKYYNSIITNPLIASYEFTDKSHLDNFIAIIKGVKRASIDFYNSDDELVLDRGEVNSGKFELLRIPCNLRATDNQEIKSIIDSVCLLNDYQTMKIAFYYNGSEQDSISIVINGRLKDNYDITFISNVYRHYQQS